MIERKATNDGAAAVAPLNRSALAFLDELAEADRPTVPRDALLRLIAIARAHVRQTAALAAALAEAEEWRRIKARLDRTTSRYADEGTLVHMSEQDEKIEALERDLAAARAEAAALAEALREACVTLRSAADLREDIWDAYARHLREVSERGNTVLADAGAAGERVRLLEQIAAVAEDVLYHDERGQGVGYAEAMTALAVAMGRLAALSAPAPARADGDEGRADG